MDDRLLEVLARRKSWLDRVALGLLIFLATLIAGLMGGASAQGVEKVRVAYLLSPIFKCANPNFPDCQAQIHGPDREAGRAPHRRARVSTTPAEL